LKIVVTGAGGRLGGKLVETLTARGHDVIGASHADLEIADDHAVRAFFDRAQPDWVVHAAAWTDVDGCAREPDKALLINGYGTGNVASAAAHIGAGVAYVSSNEVFDGNGRAPYHESAPTAPINAYGLSKWAGEQAIRHVNPHHMIIRTSWLFAHGGKNFIQSILNAAGAGKALRVVVNEIANPTYTDDLAESIAALLEHDRYGTYHLVNEGFCSRYQFARYALDRAGYAAVPIEKIASHEWQRPSKPPMFSPLANTAAAALGVKLRDWRAAVDAFLEKEGLLRG
jgi:dTDP-4-dehydrorhamnose reductase